MPGSAVLGTNLVDELIPDLVDGLRDDLHPELGVRQFRVFAVTRTYTAEFGGDAFTDSEIEITPQPLVMNYVGSIRHQLVPCGLDEAGLVVLKEISLTYTEAEISGPPANPDLQDFLIRIQDAHGQLTKSRHFQIAGPPYPDRVTDMGWAMNLIPASTPEGL